MFGNHTQSNSACWSNTIQQCLVTETCQCCTEWPNGIKHLWSPSKQTKCFTFWHQIICWPSRFIKHDWTRYLDRKMCGQQMFNRHTFSVWTGLNVHIEWSRFWALLEDKVNIVKLWKEMSVTKQLSPQSHIKTYKWYFQMVYL